MHVRPPSLLVCFPNLKISEWSMLLSLPVPVMFRSVVELIACYDRRFDDLNLKRLISTGILSTTFASTRLLLDTFCVAGLRVTDA